MNTGFVSTTNQLCDFRKSLWTTVSSSLFSPSICHSIFTSEIFCRSPASSTITLHFHPPGGASITLGSVEPVWKLELADLPGPSCSYHLSFWFRVLKQALVITVMQNIAGLGQDFSICGQLCHESHYLHIFDIHTYCFKLFLAPGKELPKYLYNSNYFKFQITQKDRFLWLLVSQLNWKLIFRKNSKYVLYIFFICPFYIIMTEQATERACSNHIF